MEPDDWSPFDKAFLLFWQNERGWDVEEFLAFFQFADSARDVLVHD